MSSRRISFPFLRIPDEEIDAGPWLRVTATGEEEPFGAQITDWDYHVDLHFRRRLSTDSRYLLEIVGLSDTEARLDVVVSAVSGVHERWRKVVWRDRIPDDGEVVMEPDFRVEGALLSNRIVLRTEVILGVPGVNAAALAPSQTGSRLWDDEATVELEGQLGRFPMEACDFGAVFPDHGAALWHLDWDPDALDAAFLGTVRLYINSAHTSFAGRVTEEDPDTLSLLLSGVMQQMCTRLLANEDFRQRYGDFGENTVGSVVSSWLSNAFPGYPAATLLSIHDTRPGTLASRISAQAQVSDG